MNDTNAVAIPYLEQAIKLNNTLVGLPALLVTVIGCLAFGYLLKAMPVYRNKWIPAGVMLFGIAANLVITPLAGAVEFGRAVIFGMVAGAASIVIHRKLLARYDSAFESGDTTTFGKPETKPETKPD